jgi:4-amino-4-deoxy-L-arabinose transferase-like glycosyltransferase
MKLPKMLNESRNILVAILLIALVIRLFISWQDVSLLVEKIILDDSFYGYQVARNIAAGNGITYNNMDPTNGIQPLWIFVITPIFFFVKNIYLAVNMILSLQTVLDVINIFLIYKITKHLFDERTALLSSLFWTFNPLIIFQTLSGVDITIYITFILASLYFYYKFQDKLNYKNLLVLGVLLGLTILSRMDGVFLLIAILAHMIWKNRMKAVSKSFIVLLAAFIVVLPWFAWNLFEFGTISQSSGIANYDSSHGIIPYFDVKPPANVVEVASTIILNFAKAFGALANQLGIVDFNVNFITIVLAAFFAVTLFYSLKFWKRMSIPIMFSILLLLFYAGYLWGVQIRYTTPIVPFIVIMIFAGFSRMLNSRLKISSTLFLALILILVIFNGSVQWEKGYFSWQREVYNDALWVRDNTPKDSTIGSFACGILMYFSDRTFVNLDGVLNYEAIEAIQNKSVYSYMKSRGVDYWVESTYQNSSFVERFEDNEPIDILKENQWSGVMGAGAENIELISVRYGVYRHLLGFDMLVAFIRAKVN